MKPLFHLSIPVDDLSRARQFYVATLGCKLGRTSDKRLDIDFFGHHVVAHLSPVEARQAAQRFESDGACVSVRHFGAIVPFEQWREMRGQIEAAVKKLRSVMNQASDQHRDEHGLKKQ